MQMTSSGMFLACFDAKSMPMHPNSICLARGVLLEAPMPCHRPFLTQSYAFSHVGDDMAAVFF